MDFKVSLAKKKGPDLSYIKISLA